jgi:LacI family transcriptional regulator, galactose operon repressor
MPKNSQPITIADVAQKAGVSIATVSRVINGSTPVSAETTERVQAAIQELMFVPHSAARVLASRRTNTIGLLLPEISGAFFSPMLRGIEAAARESGFDLLIHATDEPHRPHARGPLGEHNTDGLLVFTDSLEDAELDRLHQVGLPLVLMHQSAGGLNIPTITIENKDGAARIVDHLIEFHGRRRIVYLRGPARHEDSVWRERGYRESLELHGLMVDPALIGDGSFNREIASTTIQDLIAQKVGFDAVFCGDDDAALGVLTALRAMNHIVPDELSVVGFDDQPFAPFLTPSLTTVRAPIEQVGREAVKQLVKLIRGEPADLLTLLPTELIIRRSCGCNGNAND